MQIDIIVHGIPTGQDFSENNPPIYVRNFYNRNKGVNCFFAEVGSDNKHASTYYTLFISRNVANSGNRPGSYFAITVRVDSCYCTNVKAIYSSLEAVFRNSIVGTLLERNGDGFRFIRGRITDLSSEIEKLASALFIQLKDTLDANQIPLDSTFRLGGNPQAYNPTDLNDEQILAIVRENGGIMLSEDQPSIEQRKRMEAIEAQRRREAEEAEQRLKIERQRLIEEKAAAVERERQQAAQEIAALQKSIAAKDETLRSYNDEYQRLANQLLSANNSIAETRRAVNDLGHKMQQIATTSRSNTNPGVVQNFPSGPAPIPPRKNSVKPFIVVGCIFVLLLLLFLLINKSGVNTLNPNELRNLIGKVDSLSDEVKQNRQMITLYHSGYNPSSVTDAVIPSSITDVVIPSTVSEVDNPPIEHMDNSQAVVETDVEFYNTLYPDVSDTGKISLKVQGTKSTPERITRLSHLPDNIVSWKIYDENGTTVIDSGSGKNGPRLTNPGTYQAVFFVNSIEIKRDPKKRKIEIKQ